jgi:hypothetical protein
MFMPNFIPRMSKSAGWCAPSAALRGKLMFMRIKRIAKEIVACLNKNFKLVLNSVAASTAQGKSLVIRKTSLKKNTKIQVSSKKTRST